MYMCVYICMYMYIRIYIRIYIQTYVHTYIHECPEFSPYIYIGIYNTYTRMIHTYV